MVSFAKLHHSSTVCFNGGDPHRFSLSDAILIKDNHIRAIGGLDRALKLAREVAPFTVKIEVEVENVEEAVRAAELGS